MFFQHRFFLLFFAGKANCFGNGQSRMAESLRWRGVAEIALHARTQVRGTSELQPGAQHPTGVHQRHAQVTGHERVMPHVRDGLSAGEGNREYPRGASNSGENPSCK